MLATRLGFPISTTHALLGALIGAALGAGGAINYAALGSGFLLPLLLSPMLSAGLGFSAYALLRLRPLERDCVCVTVVETVSAGPSAALQGAGVELIIAPAIECAPLATPARFSITALLDRAHLLSAVTVCFARSVNDTPKLAALLITANAFDPRVSALGIAMAMSLGGLIMARRVAETMSLRISRIDPAQGVSANLITAVLVLSASNFGLPVSTTHVSVGSIAGAGARAGALDWAVLRNVLLSWAATLPIAAAGAALLSLAAALWR